MKRTVLCLALLLSQNSNAVEFSTKLNSEVRFDDRSGQPERYQYRFRVFPSLHLDDAKKWSVNGFAVTGDDFASSHNTINSTSTDYFYLRRLYMRYQDGEDKTELGIIPTYKGRVSSTGLAKDGWIAGLRQVVAYEQGKLELVIGELADTRASKALSAPSDLNYVELEYSAKIDDQLSYETSIDHVLKHNYVRAEIRYKTQQDIKYAFEVIGRLDNQHSKIVLSTDFTFNLAGQEAEMFAYYSYVGQDFGARAELTEDFLAAGHALALELTSSFSAIPKLEWFTKFEGYKGNSRFQLGLKYSFN